VETVTFIDVDAVERHVTLDIGVVDLQSAMEECPMFRERPLLILAELKKDLLDNFDLRDRTGGALAVVPRDVDAFMAWSALAVVATEVLGQDLQSASPPVATRLRELCFGFPDPSDTEYDVYLQSWAVPAGWQEADRRTWEELLDSDRFGRLLREFTFNFLLVTQIPITIPDDEPVAVAGDGNDSSWATPGKFDPGSSIQIAKFSYRQQLPSQEFELRERLGLLPFEIDIEAPAVGSVRSYHLRIKAPDGLALTDVLLLREVEMARTTPRPAESYEASINTGAAQIYTTSAIDAARHVAVVSLRVPVVGYLRSLMLGSWATAVILVLARVFMDRVLTAVAARADAAVTLLLVAPSLLTAYLVRPDEHAIASRILRPVRYLTAVAGVASFVAAALLVLDIPHHTLRFTWTALAVTSAAIAVFVTSIAWWSRVDVRSVADRFGTERLNVIEFSNND
jgi:hypothetical protein